MTSATLDHAERRQRGLTLVAALTALLIMSIGMTALFRLYITTRQNSHHATLSTTALVLARDKLEQLRFDINSAAVGTDTYMINATTFSRHWQDTNNLALNTRKIDVILQWSDSNGDFDLTLTTTVDKTAITDWPPVAP